MVPNLCLSYVANGRCTTATRLPSAAWNAVGHLDHDALVVAYHRVNIDACDLLRISIIDFHCSLDGCFHVWGDSNGARANTRFDGTFADQTFGNGQRDSHLQRHRDNEYLQAYIEVNGSLGQSFI